VKILVICGRYGLSDVPLAQLKWSKILANRGHDVTYIACAVNDSHELPSSSIDLTISTFNSNSALYGYSSSSMVSSTLELLNRFEPE